MKPCALSVIFLSGLILSSGTGAQAQSGLSGHLHALHEAVELSRQHNDRAAATAVERCLASAVDEGDAESEAVARTLLGPVYQKLRRYQQAETSLDRAISIWTRLKGENAPELVAPLANLGVLHFDAGQYSHAEKEISRALDIEASYPGIPGTRARLLTNLGSVYFSEQKDTLAEQKGEEALREFAPNDPATGWGYSILGAVRLRAGDFAAAEQYMNQALSIWKARLDPDDPRIGNALASLAVLYSMTNQPERAEPLFEKADEVFRKGENDQAFVIRMLAQYAAVEKRLGHKKQAKRLEKEVAQLAAVSAEAVMSRAVVDVSALAMK